AVLPAGPAADRSRVRRVLVRRPAPHDRQVGRAGPHRHLLVQGLDHSGVPDPRRVPALRRRLPAVRERRDRRLLRRPQAPAAPAVSKRELLLSAVLGASLARAEPIAPATESLYGQRIASLSF